MPSKTSVDDFLKLTDWGRLRQLEIGYFSPWGADTSCIYEEETELLRQLHELRIPRPRGLLDLTIPLTPEEMDRREQEIRRRLFEQHSGRVAKHAVMKALLAMPAERNLDAVLDNAIAHLPKHHNARSPWARFCVYRTVVEHLWGNHSHMARMLQQQDTVAAPTRNNIREAVKCLETVIAIPWWALSGKGANDLFLHLHHLRQMHDLLKPLRRSYKAAPTEQNSAVRWFGTWFGKHLKMVADHEFPSVVQAVCVWSGFETPDINTIRGWFKAKG